MKARAFFASSLVLVGALDGVLVGALAGEARADEPVQASLERDSPPASSASDNPSAAAAPPRAPVRHAWYGGPILLIDALSFTLPVLAAESTNSNVSGFVTVAALGAYVVGGPIVHGSNGAGTGVVVSSLALRLGLPIVGALFGVRIGEWANSSSNRTGNGFDLTPLFDAYYGLVIGMGTASVIDIVALSWKDEKGQRTAAPSRVHSLRMTPIVGMNREDAHGYAPTFGVAGSF